MGGRLSSQDEVARVVQQVEGHSDDLLNRLRRVARLALPLDARVAVVTEGDDQLLDLNVPLAIPFASEDDADSAIADETLIAEVERLRGDRMHFLLIPASAEQWFEDHQQFRRHVQNVYRLVFEEPGTCAVFFLQEPADAPPDGIAPDGLPVPPPEMVRLVAGMFDWDEIYGMFLSGWAARCHIDQGDAGKERRRHQGFRFDFRLRLRVRTRHPPLGAAHRCEVARQRLQPALGRVVPGKPGVRPVHRQRGRTTPRITRTSSSISCTRSRYSPTLSKHSRSRGRKSWPIVSARGYALSTVSGPGRTDLVPDEDRERFDAGELVVIREELVGTNATAAFHPERYLHEVLAPQGGFEVVDLVPGGQKDAQQDSLLLRRL